MGESENEKFLKNLRTLIKKRDFHKIRTLITNPKFDVNSRDITADLQTPFMKLCYSEIPDTTLLEIIDLLLERNADLNIQDSSGRTVVMHACLAKRTTLSDCIISDPTTRLEMFDFDGNSVLTHAVKSMDAIIAKRILEHPSGPALLEIYNSNGQKPLDIAVKGGNKKLIKLIETYEAKIPKSKQKDKKTLEHGTFHSKSSPISKSKGNVDRRASDKSIGLTTESLSVEDDSEHLLSLTTARLGRSKKCNNKMFSPDLILPSISEKTGKTRTENNESSLSRRKARRNSVSLPDLRDTPNCLVRSGENTPSILDLTSADSDYDDDDAFVITDTPNHRKPDNIRKCISEKQLSFPSIAGKGKISNPQVKRTLTESSIYSHSDDTLSRNINRLL